MHRLIYALAVAFVVSCSSLFAAEAPAQKTFFLPKNPTAAAYVLGRLSNQELVEAPRSEFVYVALLQRAGLERKYRQEALLGLAQVRNTDPMTQLARGLRELDAKGTNSEPVLRDLGAILLQAKLADLASVGEELDQLSTTAALPLTRHTAWAGLATSGGSAEAVWERAKAVPERLVDLIQGIPLLRDSELRASFYSRLRPLLDHSDHPLVRAAAISSIPAIPGHDVETFGVLMSLAKTGVFPETCYMSLARLPRESWPKEQLEQGFQQVFAHLQSIPVDRRTDSGPVALFQFASDLAALLPKEASTAANRSLRNLGVTVLTVRAIKEQMLFDRTLLVVETGKPVEITLVNDDAMPHNLVIISPGTAQEIGDAAERLSPTPDAQGRLYVPASEKVLYATKLVEPGQQARLSFTAPKTAGEYPYLCTFPGHWRRMQGTLAVVQDVEAYMASRPQVTLTEWKLEDLAPDLPKVGADRNLANGRHLFTQLACRQCHTIAGEGYAYGPDLTEVGQRWKGDRSAVLQQILEPSRAIEERYRSVSFGLKDGEEVTGMVLKDDSETVTVQLGASDTLIQTLKKSDITHRQPQKNSVMPLGLLNALSKDQILDLMAFLESGGKIPVHAHSH
jgi:putative heme-binding domain-containing protein